MNVDTENYFGGRPADHPGDALPLSWRTFPGLFRRDIKKSIGADERRLHLIFQCLRIPILMWKIRNPLFVVGAPRSGTTFLGSCIGKLDTYSYQFEPVTTKRSIQHIFYHQWSYVRSVVTYRIVYATLLALSSTPNGRFCEKTPQNSLIIPFLARAFPEAQFIHLIRDGRDSAVSLMEKPWLRGTAAKFGNREPGGFRYGPYPRTGIEPERYDEFRKTTDFHRCIWLWRAWAHYALAGGRKLPPDRYHEIHYEDLVTKPAEASNGLAMFLNLDSNARASLRTAFGDAYADSVGRWRKILSQESLAVAQAEAGPLLSELGYEVTVSC